MNVNLRAFTFVPENNKDNSSKSDVFVPNEKEIQNVAESCNLKEDFTLEKALKFCSKMAAVCYMKENFKKVLNEPEENTTRRLNQVLNSGHHSVFDHFYLTFELENVPKMLAMILNNEKAYTTSEKSARYTEFKDLPEKEQALYYKWLEILEPIILKTYPSLYNSEAKNPTLKAHKLAQENARYFISIFTPTTSLAYTVSLRQLNYLTYMLNNFINTPLSQSSYSDYEYIEKIRENLSSYIHELIKNWNLYYVSELWPKGKNRSISLFGKKGLENIEDKFSYVYQTSFECSYSCLAQNQRHRSEHCFIFPLSQFKFYVPEIIQHTTYKAEWLKDAQSIKEIIPQGTIIKTVQTGNVDTFLMKISERICGSAQLEIMRHEVDIMRKYINESEYGYIIQEYTNGKTAKCQFKNGFCGGKCMLGAEQYDRLI